MIKQSDKYKLNGFVAYKRYWEDQGEFMDKSPWSKLKVLKIIVWSEFETDLKELELSNHSLKKADGKITIRIKVPYNYDDLEDFQTTAIKLLGIQENWLAGYYLDRSYCTHIKTKK
tara:strand:+ start:87 stop:434 length:348 start_codon:yes stop_codon:yes gene_type:complete